MKKSTFTVYNKLLEHWNNAFQLSEEERKQADSEQVTDESWKELAPSPKLTEAAASFKDCANVLDYGSGSSWAGIIMAKSGCPCITAADPAENAKEMAEVYIKAYGVENQVHPICISSSWLSEVPDDTYDGFFCSNVLDVIPQEMTEDILLNTARVLKKDGKAVISFNFYMPPEFIKQRGMDLREESMIFIDDVLRMVNRTDEEWTEILNKYFTVEKLDHFAWPGEQKETRRLFYLRSNKH